MKPIADGPSVAPIHYDYRWRCEGLCSEEQLALHPMHAGIALRPLPWRLTIRRVYQYAEGERHEAHARRMAMLRPDAAWPAGGKRTRAQCEARGPPDERPRTHVPISR